MKHKLEQLLLFLAVGLLSSSCTGQQLRQTHGICGEHPIYGLDQMKAGYDIRTFSIQELDKSNKADIFAFTCDNKATVPYDDRIVSYPDQLYTPHIVSSSDIDAHTTFLDHFEEFESEEKTGILLDEKKDFFKSIAKDASGWTSWLDVTGVLGSILETVGGIADFLIPPPPKRTIAQYSSYLKTTELQASVNLNMKVYKLAFKPSEYLALQDAFIREYKALPASFLKNPTPFLEFLDRYGTHYMYKATFGGQAKYYLKHTSTSSGQKSRQEIEEEYKVWVSTLKDINLQKRTLEDKTRIEVDGSHAVGGDVSSIDIRYNSEDIKKWKASVYKKPSPMDVSMVPIIDLIANESIRIEVAQAILYSINKESVTRYQQLMNEVLTSGSLKDLHEHPSIRSYRLNTIKERFNQIYRNMNKTLNNISTDKESVITKCRKDVLKEFRDFTIAYQNTKNLLHLWIQKHIYLDVRKAVGVIFKIRRNVYREEPIPGNWYITDTEFTLFEESKVNEITRFVKNSQDLVTLKKLSLANEINDLLRFVKRDIDKYLSLRTMSCEYVAEKTDCYVYTICTTHLIMSAQKWGWRKDQNWRDYEKEVPAIKYLAQILTPMQSGNWEMNRRDLQRNNWKQCKRFYSDPRHFFY